MIGSRASSGPMRHTADGIPTTGGSFSGAVTFEVATYFFDGTSALPGAAFAGAHGTGMYRAGTTLGWSIGGTSRMTLTSTALTVPGVKGTTTNDDAAAGNMGEYISSSVSGGTVGSWVAGTAQNITSISLTAGDWDVDGAVVWQDSLTGSYMVAAISTVSGNAGGSLVAPGRTDHPLLNTSGSAFAQLTGKRRISVATTTTVYLVGQIGIATGTVVADGYIQARRVR